MCQASPFRAAPCDGREFMTKRSLYARCRVKFTVTALMLTAFVSATEGQSADLAPCAACIVLSVSPGQSILVSDPLNGLEVLVSADSPDSAPVAAALRAI